MQVYLALAGVLSLIVLFLGTVPGDEPARPPAWSFADDPFARADKVEHAIAFGAIAAALLVGLSLAPPPFYRARHLIAGASTLVLAGALEILQLNITGHRTSVTDFVASGFGIVFALAVTEASLRALAAEGDDGATV